MSNVVIDASALIKLYINEVGSPEVERAVKAADSILAPDLLLAETGNILWKYVHRSELFAADANKVLGDILQMPIQLTASSELIEPALNIAIETNRTVYDSIYLALAIQSASILITADERLVNALATTRYAAYVRHVASAT
ncbi:MAG TPA: type II toxin-antitoxin system VapC family toxin [Lacipirellulaceae bacterium]|nr:type II toxin-antitoxin system VapC family toxin [Lacipirellulaceae bacterium]